MLPLRTQNGFTLIELLVVIALLLIIAVLASLNISRVIAQNNLQAATTQLAADIRTMQQLSMEKHRNDAIDKVNITFSANSYQIITDKAAGTKFPVKALPSGIAVNSTGGSTLSFDPATLTNNANVMITLTSNSLSANNKRTIVIAKTTGRIRIDASAQPAYRSGEN